MNLDSEDKELLAKAVNSHGRAGLGGDSKTVDPEELIIEALTRELGMKVAEGCIWKEIRSWEYGLLREAERRVRDAGVGAPAGQVRRRGRPRKDAAFIPAPVADSVKA